MFTEFLITSLIVVVAPGTGVIYTTGVGLAQGTRASFVAAAGCTFGIVPHMAAAVLGVAALLQASGVAFQAFKIAGVAYLFYLAWMTVRDGGVLSLSPDASPKPFSQIARTGFLINILNPKLSIFFLAFLPQFIPQAAMMPLARMALLSGIFMGMTFAVFMFYGAFASAVRDRVMTNPTVMVAMRWSFAAAFCLLGARLLGARA